MESGKPGPKMSMLAFLGISPKRFQRKGPEHPKLLTSKF